jgi:flagellar biogenesis protein FliO
MQIHAAMPLGQNKMVQLLEVGNKILVLGITDSNINLLKEITDRDEVDRIKLQSSKESKIEANSFQDFLQSSFKFIYF